MTELSSDRPILRHRAVAELVGTAFLVMAVVGSGIAAQRLSPDDVGLQLLENALATGAALAALIIALQPVSAAFNPVVTALESLTGALTGRHAVTLVAAQISARWSVSSWQISCSASPLSACPPQSAAVQAVGWARWLPRQAWYCLSPC
jgi:glycerol uptake facilitator-like aquaporin